MTLCLLFLFALFLVTNESTASQPMHDKVVTCYVASWAGYRKSDGKFEVSDLRPELCTHLVYAFAGLNATSWTIRSLDPWRDIENGIGNYKKMTQLRQSYPHLKISLGIGGWNENSKNYSELASRPERRKIFITSVLSFLKTYDFDGFDLDWEFPASRGGVPSDRDNFSLLAKELKEAFGTNYILTAAISANTDTIKKGYNIPEISKYLDYIHIMAYDYHGDWDKMVLPNSPLKSDIGPSVEDTIKYLLNEGAPSAKLILGLAMYGRTFILNSKLDSANESPIGHASSDKGFEGPYTAQNGFMGYNEICEAMVGSPNSWRTGWDDNSSTPYAINDDRVIVYDNPRSMKAKIDFAQSMNLGGVMVWSIDTDDFRGKCGKLHESLAIPVDSPYPLMKSINTALMLPENKTPTPKPGRGSSHRISYNYLLLLLTFFIYYA